MTMPAARPGRFILWASAARYRSISGNAADTGESSTASYAPGRDLRLSRFDELLLTILSEEWQTPVDVFVHRSQLGVELRQLGSCTGDLFIPQRLVDWVGFGAVKRGAGPKPPDHPMLGSAYRITEKGIRLRDKGLEALADTPALPIGGTAAYGEPWVLLEDARLVRLTEN